MNILQKTWIYRLLQDDVYGRWVLAFVLFIGTSVPLLNIFAPEGSMFDITTFTITLLGKILCFAILALALDLVWGYCGILSLGHGAFFALGGYAMGMYLMRQIGDRGIYGNPELPDFMVFLNWDALPWYWWGFDSFGFALLIVVLAPGLLAYVFGWMAFRSRVTGVYFSIITQALTFALMQAFFMNKLGFGGNNGLNDFKDILGFNIQSDVTRSVLVFIAAIVLCFTYFMCKYIVSSKFGRVLISIRDAESRARFLGYRVEHYKLFVFTLSAVIAGIAGAIYVPLVGAANPSEFSPINSIGIVIWVALGGRGTLYGAIIGVFLVEYIKSFFTGSFAEASWYIPEWLYILGVIFILTTMFLPEGIAGKLEQILSKKKHCDAKEHAKSEVDSEATS